MTISNLNGPMKRRQFSRAYLHHVVKSGEIIAAMLLTWHNLTYYQRLMAGLIDGVAVAGEDVDRHADGLSVIGEAGDHMHGDGCAGA